MLANGHTMGETDLVDNSVDYLTVERVSHGELGLVHKRSRIA